jgi:hypothetical protein
MTSRSDLLSLLRQPQVQGQQKYKNQMLPNKKCSIFIHEKIYFVVRLLLREVRHLSALHPFTEKKRRAELFQHFFYHSVVSGYSSYIFRIYSARRGGIYSFQVWILTAVVSASEGGGGDSSLMYEQLPYIYV